MTICLSSHMFISIAILIKIIFTYAPFIKAYRKPFSIKVLRMCWYLLFPEVLCALFVWIHLIRSHVYHWASTRWQENKINQMKLKLSETWLLQHPRIHVCRQHCNCTTFKGFNTCKTLRSSQRIHWHSLILRSDQATLNSKNLGAIFAALPGKENKLQSQGVSVYQRQALVCFGMLSCPGKIVKPWIVGSEWVAMKEMTGSYSTKTWSASAPPCSATAVCTADVMEASLRLKTIDEPIWTVWT